jgi:hypothetical protein
MVVYAGMSLSDTRAVTLREFRAITEALKAKAKQ